MQILFDTPNTYTSLEYVLNALHGYGTAPRKPLLPLKDEGGESLMASFKEMIELEQEMAIKY